MVKNTGAKASIPDLPHSWDLASWPPSVWPGSGERARWTLRAYRTELLEAGALSRAGKTLIVLGKGYGRWLDRRIARVGEFESNNPNIGCEHGAAA
jgi:hypothetical protein